MQILRPFLGPPVSESMAGTSHLLYKPPVDSKTHVIWETMFIKTKKETPWCTSCHWLMFKISHLQLSYTEGRRYYPKLKLPNELTPRSLFIPFLFSILALSIHLLRANNAKKSLWSSANRRPDPNERSLHPPGSRALLLLSNSDQS